MLPPTPPFACDVTVRVRGCRNELERPRRFALENDDDDGGGDDSAATRNVVVFIDDCG